MIILDTNVVSELMRDPPDPAILRWLTAQGSELPWTTALSVFEIGFGLAALPAGARRTRLREAFRALLDVDLQGRIIPSDEAGATAAATLGRPGKPAVAPVRLSIP